MIKKYENLKNLKIFRILFSFQKFWNFENIFQKKRENENAILLVLPVLRRLVFDQSSPVHPVLETREVSPERDKGQSPIKRKSFWII